MSLVNIVQNLCDMCGKEGCTSIMATSIPFFKEVTLIAFSCEGCGNKNSEVSFSGKLPDFGVKMQCKIATDKHLNRIIVKSEYASLSIPELSLEIPPRTQKGSMNSVEGVLKKMISGLEEGQENRKETDLESYNKIQGFIEQAKDYATGVKLPFTVVLDDPSGNSCIQNLYAPESDPYNTVEHYPRTREQLLEMGYATDDGKESEAKEKEESKEQTEENKGIVNNKQIESNTIKPIDLTQPLPETKETTELAVIDIPCYACGEMGKNRMCICQLPYSKELITMCFECDKCGYKSTEVKSGGGIAEKGKSFSLSVKSVDDLSRELYKVICAEKV